MSKNPIAPLWSRVCRNPVTRPKTAYSTDGIECPFCGHTFMPDEASYFDESGYDFKCDECEGVFRVEPQCSWAFRSAAITWD